MDSAEQTRALASRIVALGRKSRGRKRIEELR